MENLLTVEEIQREKSIQHLLNRKRLSISDMFFNHGGVIVGSKWWKSNKEFQEHVHRCAKDFIDVNGLDEITPLMLVDDFMERL